MPDRQPVFPDNLESNARVAHRVNSTGTVSKRRQINWPSEFAVTDDPINEEVDLALSGGMFGQWTTWTPALTASTTNPTLGTGGSVATGRYIQLGKTVIAIARLQFGTSGVTAGSGNYRVSVPVAIKTTLGSGFIIGYGDGYDISTDTVRAYQLTADVNNQRCFMNLTREAAASYTVTNAVPWTWADLDQIDYQVTYEAA